MLEYTKMILRKVSFDHRLFKKELYKSIQYLAENEQRELEAWVFNNYGVRYQLLPAGR